MSDAKREIPEQTPPKNAELTNINEAIASAIKQQGLVRPDLLEPLLTKCNQERQHLGQLLVKEGHLKMGQLVKLLQAISGKLQRTAHESAASFLPTGPATAAGTRLGNYELVEEIGRGGMGVVYRAKELTSNRIVAIKVLLHEATADAAQVRRFLREIDLTASLQHPNIITIYGTGEEKDCHYFAMQYVEGSTTLEHIMKKETLALTEQVAILAKVCRALHHAHCKKILHRDLKPSNILLTKEHEPLLCDFGLAKQVGGTASLTQTGTAIGTPFYMSPEQVNAVKHIDAKSDIYSLGVILYQMLTGRLPFIGESLPELYLKITEEEAVPPHTIQPTVPPALEAICLKALEKSPGDRYATALAMAEDLEQSSHSGKVKAQRLRLRRALRQWQRRHARWVLLMPVLGMLVCGAAAGLWHLYKEPLVRTSVPVAAVSSRRLQQEVEEYYRQGLSKLQDQQSEEAILYLEHAAQLLELGKKEKMSAPSENLKRLQELEHQLGFTLVETWFNAGDYQKVYEMGNKLLPSVSDSRQHGLLWLIGRAAYHCEWWEEAQRCFGKIIRFYETRPPATDKDKEIYRSSRYYEGLVDFREGLWPQARDRFQALATHLEQERASSELLPQVYIHYSAASLADLNLQISPAMLEPIGRYLSIAKEQNPHVYQETLYRDTMARYLLQKAQVATPKGAETASPTTVKAREAYGQEIITHVDYCLQKGAETFELYYLRAKANWLCKNFPQVKADLKKAAEIDPSNTHYVGAKLELLGDYAEPDDFQNFRLEFLRGAEIGSKIYPEFFSKNFQNLHRQTLAQSLSMSRGIPFSPEKFREFYALMQNASPTTRTMAESAIGSMLPASQVLQALQEAHAGKDSQQKLWNMVQQAEQKRRRQKLMVSVSRMPAYEPLGSLRPFMQKDDVEILQQIWTDSQISPFLRFLAVRILANLPVAAVRKDLWHTYHKLSEPVDKILLGRALDEIGFFHTVWDQEFLDRLAQRFRQGEERILLPQDVAGEEFVQTLLAEFLSPCDASGASILCWMLQHGTGAVKVTAASRYSLTSLPAEVRPVLVKAIQEGMTSSDPETRVWMCAVLGQYANLSDYYIRHFWRDILIDEVLPLSQWRSKLNQWLREPAPRLQKTVLRLWPALEINQALRLDESLPIHNDVVLSLRSLWQNANPAVRCLAIINSGHLGDGAELFKITGDRQHFSLLDRLVSMIGGRRGPTGTKDDQGSQDIIRQLLKFYQDPQESPVLRSILLYMMATTQNLQKGVERVLVQQIVTGALKNPETLLRCFAIVSIGHLPSIPAKAINTLVHLKDNDPYPHIRAAAIGALLNQTQRKNLPEFASLHQWVKQKSGAEGQLYRLGAVWGYNFPITFTYSADYELACQINWEPEELLKYFHGHFCDDIQKRPALVPEYRRRLEKTLDLLLSTPQEELAQQYAYLLASLYEISKDYANARQLLENMRTRLGSTDIRLTELWTQMLLREERATEAKETLESLLAKLPTQADESLEVMAQRMCHEAQLKRSLAQVYIHLEKQGNEPKSGQPNAPQNQQPNDKMESLIQEQLLLFPTSPQALTVALDYYSSRKDYLKAIALHQNALAHMPQNGSPYLNMAKLYALMGKRPEALQNLRWFHAAARYNAISSLDLSQYPEFSHLLEDRQFREEWSKISGR